jgi:hypothetical protein
VGAAVFDFWAHHPRHNALLMTLYGGLRVSEALGLKPAAPIDPPMRPTAPADKPSSRGRFVQDEATTTRYNPHSGGRFSSTDFMPSATGAPGERPATWRTRHKVLFVSQP